MYLYVGCVINCIGDCGWYVGDVDFVDVVNVEWIEMCVVFVDEIYVECVDVCVYGYVIFGKICVCEVVVVYVEM